jgi:hypothetical protein
VYIGVDRYLKNDVAIKSQEVGAKRRKEEG